MGDLYSIFRTPISHRLVLCVKHSFQGKLVPIPTFGSTVIAELSQLVSAWHNLNDLSKPLAAPNPWSSSNIAIPIPHFGGLRTGPVTEAGRQ